MKFNRIWDMPNADTFSVPAIGGFVKSYLKDSRVSVDPFGWNSCGMGDRHGFEQIEILLVAHGGAHNDTICLAERRRPQLQKELI